MYLYTWKWIEGEKALNEFFKKFSPGDSIHWADGTVGTSAKCKVYLTYKYVFDGEDNIIDTAEMYLLWMPISTGSKSPNQAYQSEFSDIRHMPYEQIRLDKTAILLRRE